MACSLVKPKLEIADRFDHIMDIWSRICGGGRPTFANSTYLSERATADRNFCLAYMMQEEGAFPAGTNLVETLELYFMLVSFFSKKKICFSYVCVCVCVSVLFLFFFFFVFVSFLFLFYFCFVFGF